MSAAPTPQPNLPRAVEIRNILVATDFGPASEGALRYAHGLARRYGSKVFLLHVLPPFTRSAVPMDKFPSQLDRDRQSATEQMVKLLARDWLKEVPHDALLERGTMQEVIPTTIRQSDIDLVVVGTHGHHALGKLLLGSAAEQIFRLARCPVITVGPDIENDRMTGGVFPHVLFATDFSAGSLNALPWALSLVNESHGRLTLLHVVQEISEAGLDYLDEVIAACKQRLTELLPPGTGTWCQPEFFVEVGPAADTILKVAAEGNANLIAMGAQASARPGLRAHLPWATAYRVVCHAQCPVLTVRSHSLAD